MLAESLTPTEPSIFEADTYALPAQHRLKVQAEDIGCYLKRHRNHLTRRWEYSIVFDFEVHGIHPSLYLDVAEPILKRVAQLLKGLHNKPVTRILEGDL